MKKRWHRIVSLMLCAAMVCSSPGMTVSAEELQTEQSVEADAVLTGQEETGDPAVSEDAQEGAVPDAGAGEEVTEGAQTGQEDAGTGAQTGSEDIGADAQEKPEDGGADAPEVPGTDGEPQGTPEDGEMSAPDDAEDWQLDAQSADGAQIFQPEDESAAEADALPEIAPEADASGADVIGMDTVGIAVMSIEELADDVPADSPQEDAPSADSGVKDETVPVIKVTPAAGYTSTTYFCKAPTVEVTDAGGNLESIKVEKKGYTEDREVTWESVGVGTIEEDKKSGSVVLEDQMGSVRITATDSANHTATRELYVNHSIKSLRRTTIPASCTKPQMEVSFCVCGECGEDYGFYSYVDTTGVGDNQPVQSALGHDLTGDQEAERPCGAPEDLSLKLCKRCGLWVTDGGQIYELTEDAGHEWEEKVKEPTCLEPGLKYRECKNCGAKQVTLEYSNANPELTPRGHLFGSWKLKDGETASCDNSYKEVQECQRPGCNVTVERVIPAGYHTWSSLKTLKEPSCTEAGERGYECTRCHATKKYDSVYGTIPATGHTFQATGDCTKAAICTVCGNPVEQKQEHSWNTRYSADGTGHWKTCTNAGCTVTSEKAEHTRKAGDFLCTSRWTCSECGYSVQGNKSHTLVWESDGTHHWQKCSVEGCTFTTNKTTHRYVSTNDCTKGQVCADCGHTKYEPKESHNFGEKWSYSVSMHWQVCQNEGCTQRTHFGDPGYGEHVYGPLTDCTKGRACTVCGYMSYTPQLNHNFHNAPIVGLEDGHYQKCKNSSCRQLQKADGVQFAHTGGTATCARQAICDICHQPYGELSTENHESLVIKNEKAATTQEDGYTGDQYCMACGVPGEGTLIKKGETIPRLQQECTHEGTTVKEYDDNACWDACTNCHETWNRVEHTLAYDKDGTVHWQYCVRCKHQSAKIPHTPDPNQMDYDCTTELTCRDCGYVIEPAAEHVFDDEYASDSDAHWHVCENPNCSQTDAKQSHVAEQDDGDCTTDVFCSACGYEMTQGEEDHQYSGVWEADETGHFQRCLNDGCRQELREEHVPADDDRNCTTPKVCPVCDWVEEEGQTSHSFGGEYLTSETGHWQKCQNPGCEELSGVHPHTGGTANCKEAAVCEVCKKQYGETDPAAHTGGTENRGYVEPTLEAEGYSGDTFCLGCGRQLAAGEILNRLTEEHKHSYIQRSDGTHHWQECECGVREDYEEHSLTEWQSDSTHHWRSCGVCGRVEGRGDHTYENGACTACGAKQPVHEHDFEWHSEEKGHWQQCRTCGEIVNADTHSYDWDDTAHWQECAVCGRSTEKTAHTLEWRNDGTGHWQVCTQEGCGYQTDKAAHEAEDDHDCTTPEMCGVCGTVMKEAQEHSWGDYRHSEQGHWTECKNEGCGVTTAPEPHRGGTATCVSPAVCEVCGVPYGDRSTVHAWGEWLVTAEPTVFAAGAQQRSCTLCGTVETGVLEKLNPAIEVNAESIPMKVKQSTTKLEVSGLSAGDYVVSWKSSDPKIVKVNKKGRIKAKKKGKVTITVTLASGLQKKIKVNVKKAVVKTTGISVASKQLSLKKGDKHSLEVTVKPITTQQKVTYISSNRKVATVDKKGVVTAKGAGKANITIKSGSKKAVVQVTVGK